MKRFLAFAILFFGIPGPMGAQVQTGSICWHTAGPRLSAVYDLTGNGRTAVKA